MAGAKLVFPGQNIDGASLYKTLNEERVTVSFGVPTVWLGLFEYLDSHPDAQLPYLKRICVGGSAAPRSMIERFAKMGVNMIHLWVTN